MSAHEVLVAVELSGVVPAVEIHDLTDAVPLARTLVQAGPPIIEMTLRTPVELEAVARIIAILDAGLGHVKFFLAGALGRITTLKALAGPSATTGVRLVPTGGATATNFDDYLALASVFAIGGTWVVPPADVAARCWDEIGVSARGVIASRIPHVTAAAR